VYDRRQKKQIQKKWCRAVEHLSTEILPTTTLPRKLTVYVQAPPGDGLMIARDHFHEYVKPILVAASLDWDAVEGRREGDIRAGAAEKIRILRRLRGEHGVNPAEETAELLVAAQRERSGVGPPEGVAGDLVIGRHTWKEYIRGLHEGWLGPLDPPTSVEQTSEQSSSTVGPDTSSSNSETSPPTIPPDNASSTDAAASASTTAAAAATDAPKPPEDTAKEKPKRKPQLPPYNTTQSYSSSQLALSTPSILGPSSAISFPHILGFLNTPTRIYRFLNKRKLADEVGRETVAAVLALYEPYGMESGETFRDIHAYSATPKALSGSSSSETHSGSESPAAVDQPADVVPTSSSPLWQQQSVLQHEEAEWHKSIYKPLKDDDGNEIKKERPWLDPVVIDARIGERMRKFVLDPSEDRRADEIAKGLNPWWKDVWSWAVGENEHRRSVDS
jgi:mitochondrial import inner membrane translocase subunit TIM54